jgi:hypothetical protein
MASEVRGAMGDTLRSEHNLRSCKNCVQIAFYPWRQERLGTYNNRRGQLSGCTAGALACCR